MPLIFIDYGPSERRESQGNHFEMLFSEGNANYGNVQNYTPHQVTQGYPDTAEEYPQDIQKRAQASRT
jgi:hypothetical protein